MGGKFFYLHSFMIVCVRFYIMVKFFILHDLVSIVLFPSYYLKVLGARLLRLICLTTCDYERLWAMLTKKYSFSERRLTYTGREGFLQLLFDMPPISKGFETVDYYREPHYTRA